jgi:PUA domain protein
MIKTLSKSETKLLHDQLWQLYRIDIITKKDLVQTDSDNKFICVNKDLWFFNVEDRPVPTLRLLLKNNFLKKITVDMGAVKHVASGADVMRPGIVSIDDGINAEDFVAIVDVNNKRPLAIGIALFNSKEIEAYKTGRVVKNIHYVGDKIWNA